MASFSAPPPASHDGCAEEGRASLEDLPALVHRSVSLDAVKSGAFGARPAPAWMEPTRFETAAPPEVVVRRAVAAVEGIGGEIVQVKQRKSKIKCKIFRDFSLINFQITVYHNIASPSSSHIVEFQKRRGDSFGWNLVFSELRSALADLSSQELVRGLPAPVEIAADARLGGDVPEDLAALARSLCQPGNLEATSVAARAFAASAVRQNKDESAVWAEVPAAKRQKLTESLTGLQKFSQAAGGEEEDGDLTVQEIQSCVAATLASIGAAPRRSPSPMRYCMGDFSLKGTGHSMGCFMLSSSA